MRSIGSNIGSLILSCRKTRRSERRPPRMCPMSTVTGMRTTWPPSFARFSATSLEWWRGQKAERTSSFSRHSMSRPPAAVLFIAVLIRVGPGAVASLFAELSWYLPLIVVFPYALMTALDTLGWRFAFRRDAVPFRSLLAARLAGEAFNMTTPTASVGGEAVKAWFIRPWVPITEGLPSVIVAKTTIVIGQALFLVVGLVAAHAALPSSSLVIRGMQWLLVVQVLAVTGFVGVQAGGALRGSTRWLQKGGWLSDRPLATLTQINDELAHFY